MNLFSIDIEWICLQNFFLLTEGSQLKKTLGNKLFQFLGVPIMLQFAQESLNWHRSLNCKTAGAAHLVNKYLRCHGVET